MWRIVLVVVCLTIVPRSVSADLKTDETKYGAAAYVVNKKLIDQACTCDKAGGCKRKITDDEFATLRTSLYGAFGKTMKKSYPALMKKLAGMSELDATFYVRGLEDKGAERALKKKQAFERWQRMFHSCSLPPGELEKKLDDFQKNHDGSLRGDGTGEDDSDLADNKLDEPSGIAAFVSECVAAATKDGPNPGARSLCVCGADLLRTSSPAVVKTFLQYGLSIIEDDLKKCGKWDGTGASPFHKQGMRSSADVETAYARCRKADKKRTAGFCNKQVAAGK